MIENDADAPYVDAVVNDGGAVVGAREALGRQIPVGAGALRGELDPVSPVLPVDDLLRQTEVRDFDVTTHRSVSK